MKVKKKRRQTMIQEKGQESDNLLLDGNTITDGKHEKQD